MPECNCYWCENDLGPCELDFTVTESELESLGFYPIKSDVSGAKSDGEVEPF